MRGLVTLQRRDSSACQRSLPSRAEPCVLGMGQTRFPDVPATCAVVWDCRPPGRRTSVPARIQTQHLVQRGWRRHTHLQMRWRPALRPHEGGTTSLAQATPLGWCRPPRSGEAMHEEHGVSNCERLRSEDPRMLVSASPETAGLHQHPWNRVQCVGHIGASKPCRECAVRRPQAEGDLP